MHICDLLVQIGELLYSEMMEIEEIKYVGNNAIVLTFDSGEVFVLKLEEKTQQKFLWFKQKRQYCEPKKN